MKRRIKVEYSLTYNCWFASVERRTLRAGWLYVPGLMMSGNTAEAAEAALRRELARDHETRTVPL